MGKVIAPYNIGTSQRFLAIANEGVVWKVKYVGRRVQKGLDMDTYIGERRMAGGGGRTKSGEKESSKFYLRTFLSL